MNEDTAPPHEWTQVLPAVPSSLREIRTALAGWLGEQRWPPDDADDVILAVNEALTNVIEHAYPAGRPGPVRVHALSGAGSAPETRRVTVEISDRGSWDPEHRVVDDREFRGHGFAVMSGLTADMHIRRGAAGTTVILVSNDAPLWIGGL
ncbi:ATP-binding protein [Pseudonocardia adelaidensis]|uniref:ATP-binding protein n=1 Tax=Pseudonocardia adelaidensis TaxID=648754 RepID=A0ABP9NPU4_9PSEU